MTGKQLGQLRPTDTNAASVYTPAPNSRASVENIIVCNNTALAADYSIFVDLDGTTYDASTATHYAVNLDANTSIVINLDLHLNNLNANIAVQSGTANALSFTVNGIEHDV